MQPTKPELKLVVEETTSLLHHIQCSMSALNSFFAAQPSDMDDTSLEEFSSVLRAFSEISTPRKKLKSATTQIKSPVKNPVVPDSPVDPMPRQSDLKFRFALPKSVSIESLGSPDMVRASCSPCGIRNSPKPLTSAVNHVAVFGTLIAHGVRSASIVVSFSVRRGHHTANL